MMGRQVNFFMNNDDLAEFEKRLLDKHDALFLQPVFSSPTMNILSSLVIPETENVHRSCYLCRKQDRDQIVFKEVVPTNPKISSYWSVISDSSPIIEFDRCYWNNEFIRRGRLYFVVRQYVQHGLAEKPQDFLAWGDNILRWVRRNYLRETTFGFYIGPNTAKWVQENDIELKQV